MTFDVAIVQFKPRKGDVEANLATLRGVFAQLLAGPAPPPQLVVLPEAAMTGYFLEGAVYELSFSAPEFAAKLDATWRAAGGTATIDIVCGFYENHEGTYHNSALYATIGGGGPKVVHVHRKMFLPTYGVFDEERFLSRGRHLDVFPTPFGIAAILICEDAWHSIMPTIAALKGARLIIIPSASPGRGLAGKGMLESVERWRATATLMASEHGVYVLYAGLTGFEGGKGMSGSSCIVSPRGELLEALDELSVAILRARLDGAEVDLARATLPLLGDLAAVLPDLWYDAALPLPKVPSR
ncbi:MAG: nitrilase-related carbon-nitrogen hydrolase [Candidatus Lustribacter sp.]|jgi:predicted amidohydrolase